MEYKKIRLIIVVVTAFTIFTTACSISTTRNYYYTTPNTSIKSDSTSHVLKLDPQHHKPNDRQR